MANVKIDSGPITADLPLNQVPKEKWQELISVRNRFLHTRLPYDCRCLLEFVADADSMFASLGYSDVDDLIKRGFDLDPKQVQWAVDGLRSLKPNDPLPYQDAIDEAQARAEAKAKALDAATPDLQPVGTNRYSDRVGDKKNVTNSKPSNDAAYAIARLRRDRPDIRARVLAGEITPNAGMIEAGFRKKRPSTKRNAVQQIEKLWATLTVDEKQSVRNFIDADK